ncbi:MAG: hypothetical protein JST22_10865 [Bacteroidetes bacterium]|nr:hypothetical protein [Bacteroidota bacterium]
MISSHATRAVVTCFFLALILGVFTLHAQPPSPGGGSVLDSEEVLPPYVGVRIAPGYHMQTAARIAGAGCGCETEAENKVGLAVGLSAQISLSKRWYLLPAVTYDSRPGAFHAPMDTNNPMVQIESNGFDTVPGKARSVVARTTLTYRVLNSELLLGMRVTSFGRDVDLVAALGPAVGYVVGSRVSQRIDLVDPDTFRFVNPEGLPADNNGRTLILMDDSETPALNRLWLSAKLGLLCNVRAVDGRFMISPGLFYDLALTNVTSVDDWKVHSLMFHLDFRGRY